MPQHMNFSFPAQARALLEAPPFSPDLARSKARERCLASAAVVLQGCVVRPGIPRDGVEETCLLETIEGETANGE